ncbi:biopolymer transporter ExbD [Hoylesella timonensis]|uniref:ExbD/TolR family protein n=1 Tax=Hoylesella timonensis TaxID=386414 RepID=UPI003369E705
MIQFRRRLRGVPELNTASLPDLIFTVLFFFMIVTHMREVTLKVKYRVPQGTELTRLTKKSAVVYLYIGIPIKSFGNAIGQPMQVQLNDRLVLIDEIADYVSAERDRMSPEDQQQMIISIRADKHTSMATINQVKQELRNAKALKISYSAENVKQK